MDDLDKKRSIDILINELREKVIRRKSKRKGLHDERNSRMNIINCIVKNLTARDDYDTEIYNSLLYMSDEEIIYVYEYVMEILRRTMNNWYVDDSYGWKDFREQFKKNMDKDNGQRQDN